MSILTKAQFVAKYTGVTVGEFPDNTSGAIKAQNLRNQAQDIADSLPFDVEALLSVTGDGVDNTDPVNPVIVISSQLLGDKISSATSKSTPVDADQVGLMDSESGNILKKLSWANIKAALPAASPIVKGIAKLYTDLTASNTDGSATQAAIKAVTDLKAPLASPALTGTPTAPTAGLGTNTTQLATTAFVQAALPAAVPDASPTVKGKAKLYADIDAANVDGAVDQATSQFIYNSIFISD